MITPTSKVVVRNNQAIYVRCSEQYLVHSESSINVSCYFLFSVSHDEVIDFPFCNSQQYSVYRILHSETSCASPPKYWELTKMEGDQVHPKEILLPKRSENQPSELGLGILDWQLQSSTLGPAFGHLVWLCSLGIFSFS